jgi:flavin reductase (DIM6/NTAB) family NADH-FMN oxidoreductase RutF
MEFAIADTSVRALHRLMTSLVVPRPIAFVTTRNEDGSINSAPFSFFNGMCADPPTIAIGTGYRGDYERKDTSHNIIREKEFVVNMVDEALVEQMNICAVDFDPGIEEHVEANLSFSPSKSVKPPRIATAPAAMECVLFQSVTIAPGREIHIGTVKHIYIRDDLIEADTGRLDADKLGLVGRLHGPGWYARTEDRFQCKQMSVDEWKQKSLSAKAAEAE